MDYSRIFQRAIDRLHAEGRYRVFIDILRNKGGFSSPATAYSSRRREVGSASRHSRRTGRAFQAGPARVAGDREASMKLLAMMMLMTGTGTVGATAPQGAAAQPATVAGPQEEAEPRSVAGEVRRIVASKYVLPATRAKLDAMLAKGLADGRYDVADPAELTRRLNADLDSIAHDKHLSIQFAPPQAAMLKEQARQGGAKGAGFARMAQVRNHGLREMKVLEGNIRYLAIDGFVWTGSKTAEAYDTAIRFLQGGDAIVIDLRNNGGGDAEAVHYLISHFVEPGKPLVTFYGNGQPPNAVVSLADVPAGRLLGKPLYVLTSGRTASAAEELSGHVAGYRLGELVGANTAGAGFENELLPVAGKYVLSVSVARAVLASTGADWERKGIAPTIPARPDQALDVAQMHAAQQLAQTAGSLYEKQAYAGLAVMLKARIDPATPALPLSAYAGRFGEGNVALKDGRLVAEGPDGRPRVLLPLGENLFAVDGDAVAKVEFQVAGGVPTELDILLPGGGRRKLPRVAQP